MSDHNEHQLLKQFLLPEREERLREVASRRTRALTVVLDNAHKDHNISAVIRSVDAFGLQEIHLVGREFSYNRSVSQGAERWVDLVRHASPEEAIFALKERGFTIAVLHPEPLNKAGHFLESVPVLRLPFDQPLALVFGSEKEGLSAAFKAAADLAAYIPMFGFVESFNVSVAVAITLFCSTVGGGKPARIPAVIAEAERDALVTRWVKSDVRNADLILREVKRRSEE